MIAIKKKKGEVYMIIIDENIFNSKPLFTFKDDHPTTDPHRHKYIEIFYILNGTATHYINNYKTQLNVGDLYIVRCSDTHHFSPINNTPLLHRNFLIKINEFQRICDFINPKLFNTLNDYPTLLKLNVDIHIINNFEKQLELFSGDNTLYGIIFEILGLFSNSSLQKQENAPLWLHNLLAYLDKPQTFHKSIPEITDFIHFSQSYICTTFKKWLGVTITEYRLTQKLEYSYLLIQNSSLSINEIVEACGFTSRPYFYKEFKKKYGVIPGTLRKKK